MKGRLYFAGPFLFVAISVEAGVFGFGLFQDGNVLVSVLPQPEKILIGDFSFRGFAGKRLRAAQPKMRERAKLPVKDDSAVINNFLILLSRLFPLLSHSKRFRANINRAQSH